MNYAIDKVEWLHEQMHRRIMAGESKSEVIESTWEQMIDTMAPATLEDGFVSTRFLRNLRGDLVKSVIKHRHSDWDFPPTPEPKEG